MPDLVFIERRDSDSEKWRKYPADVIPAWVADSDYAAAEPILAALRERVAHGVFGYTAPSPQLMENTLNYFARRWQWEVQPEWVIHSPGLGAGIHNSCRMAQMAGNGGLLTPQPIYHVFRTAPAVTNTPRLDMPMTHHDGRWHLPAEVMDAALAAAAKGAGGKIFQLCNPHNPNGKVYTREELLAIGEFCCRHDLTIFSDEVHADLILDDDAPHIPIASLSPEIAARTITMQSPSKTYNIAGLNLAFIVISDDALRQRYVEAARGKVIKNLNPFGFAAATAAYSGECDPWLQAQLAHLRANRDRLRRAVDELPGISTTHLQSTYLAWINVRELGLADAPAHFIKHGIGLSPGADFGDADYMRLNFACSAPRLEEIISRLAAAVRAA